jgi:hypothetical protein
MALHGPAAESGKVIWEMSVQGTPDVDARRAKQ